MLQKHVFYVIVLSVFFAACGSEKKGAKIKQIAMQLRQVKVRRLRISYFLAPV